MRTTLQTVLAWLLGLLMLGFSVPKLSASDVSVSLFTQISSFTGLPARGFMYFTGALELFVGVLLVVSLLLGARGHLLYPLSLLLVIGVMLGALFTELVIRPGEDLALTILATVLLLLSAYLLWPQRQTVLGLVPGLRKA